MVGMMIGAARSCTQSLLYSRCHINRSLINIPGRRRALVQRTISFPATHTNASALPFHPQQQQQQPQRSKFQAYIALTRFHAPIGSILLFLPCAQSLILAADLNQIQPQETAKMLMLFGLGAFVMRSAGCVINDLWDRDLDKQVTRTASRPIASGEITVFQGVAFLGGLLSVGLGILTQLNVYSIMLGASSMLLVVVYPLMKRVTYVPQLVLGLAFNWGALLGYPALVGVQDWQAVIPLYAAGICWTIIYDTIYAHQDIKDDAQVGIKSTALLFRDQTKPMLSLLTIGQFASLAYLGLEQGLGPGFWAGSGLSLAYTMRLIYLLDIHDVKACWTWFKKSQIVGWLIASGLLADYAQSLMENNSEKRGASGEQDR